MEKSFTRPKEYARRDTAAIMVIMLAAVTYLALRARTAPRYFWMQLDTEQGWREVDGMLDLIIKRVLSTSSLRQKSPRTPAQRRSRVPRKAAARGRT